jgi:glycosyltransferase involved in cell wall biosynthesis
MKILFVLISLPFPTNIGQRMRNYSQVRALQMEGHEVALLAFGDQEELTSARAGLAGLCTEVDVLPEPGGGARAGYAGRLRALTSSLPYGAWRMRSDTMRTAVSKRLATQSFDLVLCDDVYQIGNLPFAFRVPIVLDKPSIVHEEVRRFIRHQRNLLTSAYGWIEHRRLRRLEMQACSKVAAVWACSERDREILASGECPVPIAVVPNAISVDDYVPAETDDGRTVLYVGAMDWLPNRDAVAFFVSEVMPELRRLVPDFNFVVAGREPPPEFRRRYEQIPNVRFTGTLPDLRPVIAQAAICVVPLRIGSGTRLKILEAAAMAKAVVSTTVGAEGLTLKDGEDIVIADEPRTMARAIAALLADRRRRLEIGRAARRHVAAEYGIPALRRALREALALIGEQSAAAVPLGVGRTLREEVLSL